MPPERHDRCRLVSQERYCSKHRLQLGQPLPESRSGSNPSSELRSPPETGRGLDVRGCGSDNRRITHMDFSLNRMPSTQKEIEWQWKRAVKENIDFSASRVNGTNYDFGANLDYFNMTDAKADQISFIGRRYEFFEQAVGLRDFRLEIFGDIHQDTQIGMILNGISRYREESSPYGVFASYRYIGRSVYCAITVCLVDKDWGSEMDVAVIEVSQDENAYVLPVEISEEALDYFSFDDIMRLAYWLGNFWVGVQYEINNHPEEIRVVEQRGPISADDDAYKSQDRIVLIKRIIAVDKDGRPIEYAATGSGRKYHVPAWGGGSRS